MPNSRELAFLSSPVGALLNRPALSRKAVRQLEAQQKLAGAAAPEPNLQTSRYGQQHAASGTIDNDPGDPISVRCLDAHQVASAQSDGPVASRHEQLGSRGERATVGIGMPRGHC